MRNETVDSLDAKPVYRTVKTSRLFEQITELPEYYPTRTERAIFQAC